MQSGNRDAAARLETFAVGMRMGVEEPRHDRTTVEVDELGGGSGVLEERRVVADGRDVATIAPRPLAPLASRDRA